MVKEKFDYSKLKGKIIEKFGTQSSFINNISMSMPTFIKKINGDGYFGQNEIEEIMLILEIDIKEVYDYFFAIEVRKT